MLALLELEGLGAPADGSTPEGKWFPDTRAYLEKLAQSRRDKASLVADVAELKQTVEKVEKERNDALAQAYKAGVDRDNALAEVAQLKADIAREKARKEAEQRAVAEAAAEVKEKAAAAVKEKADAERRWVVAADIASRARVEKEKADRKAREEAKEAEAERLRQHPETEEERKSRELSELMRDYENSGHDAMRNGGR
jgi:membrane protein involved in colicin uptake